MRLCVHAIQVKVFMHISGYAAMELSSHISVEEQKMKASADKAIEYFTTLPYTSGNWDTFIPKYVQVYRTN